MTLKSQEFKAAMSAVREQIATAKRRGSSRGFADYQGCRFICYSFIDILENAGKAAERGEYAFAYSVAALILVNLAKLASTADDSAGGITDARGYVEEVLEKACSGVEYDSEEAEYIFLQSIKDSQNKAFDGWDEFAYDLLLKTARLATEDNENKMLAAADELYGKASDRVYSSWADEYDTLVRLEVIKATGSEIDVDDYIKENLKYDTIRRIAVNNAITASDYARAETLCLEKLQTDSDEPRHEYSKPSEWRFLLFEVYDKSGDSEKKIRTAEDLLFRFDIKYYAILKHLLTEKGKWDTERQPLLTALGNSLPYHLFMKILSDEGETLWLLEEIRKHPTSVFDYGKQLAAKYPSQTYALCLDVIRSQANDADTRVKYKKVCGLIKKLFDFGGVEEVDSIIGELKTKFPRRPAMLEELDALSGRLAKKRK